MEPTTSARVILFNLDGTLFDHHHSLRLAIRAIQTKYPPLADKDVNELVEQYNFSLQEAYDKYLGKEITYEEADTEKIHLFFAAVGLPNCSLDEVKQFRTAYKAVYRENRKATAGSIETLTRLRENGFRIAIVTNRQTQDQTAKAEAIGILHLVDRIISSEEAGHRKPDPRIFQYAMKHLGVDSSLHTIHMVGDSVDSDIQGALNAKLAPILYSPEAQDSQRLLYDQRIPVIRHMGQLPSYLGIPSPPVRATDAPSAKAS